MAYIIGIAIGDGNLTNPNGRAPKLRVTCDTKYPNLIETIRDNLQKLLPNNKIGITIRKENCVDVYCYSNKLETWLGWKAKKGSKYTQKVRVPHWIKKDKQFLIPCLRGLFQTDGSIYKDRGYIMVNFTTVIPKLAEDVTRMIARLGFKCHLYCSYSKHLPKYTIRISKNVKEFIHILDLTKD